jgi:O-antigen ligase
MQRLTPGRLVVAMVLLIGSAGLAMAYIPETLVKRLSTTSSEVEDANFGHRFKLWVAGIHAFEQRPMTGHGIGGFVRATTPELGPDARVAHNTYLSVLVEEGMPGLILYLSIFLAVYRSLVHLPKLERRFALTLLTTLCIAILPLTWEDRKPVWFVLSALLGLAKAYKDGVGVRFSVPEAHEARLARSAATRWRQPLTAPIVNRDDSA